MRAILILLATIYILSSCTPQSDSFEAHMIVTNAHIWTGDDQSPIVEALAVAGDTIWALGTAEEIEALKGANTAVIDAQGQMVVPGFIDCHVHFLAGGYGLSSVKLRDANTPEEFAQRIKAHAETLPEGTWILNGDWDHELWGGELPSKDWIDEFTPNHPVFVSRLDGHMALANSAAIEAAGITKDTPEVEGGSIIRTENGEPAGVFKDNAMNLVFSKIPPPGAEQDDRALLAAMEFVASHGVTTIHNMDQSGVDLIDVFQRARDNKTQLVRAYVAVRLQDWQQLEQLVAQDGTGDDWVKIGVLKGMVDGSLGSHTAAFFEPFTDAPLDTGLFVTAPEDIYNWVSDADKAGLQVAVHAIGDKAINNLLDIFERVAAENGEKDRRFRVEHAQHLSPDDIRRFSEMNVVASMQPYHAIDDGRWAEKVIGPERIKTTYAFKSLLDASATLAFGSDWSVAPPTPLEGIHAAVTRRTIDGANFEGWVPEQKITTEAALRAYTVTASYASFDDQRKGSLQVGKLADFVILDHNILEIDPELIKDTKVVTTVVGGKVVYEAEE